MMPTMFDLLIKGAVVLGIAATVYLTAKIDGDWMDPIGWPWRRR